MGRRAFRSRSRESRHARARTSGATRKFFCVDRKTHRRCERRKRVKGRGDRHPWWSEALALPRISLSERRRIPALRAERVPVVTYAARHFVRAEGPRPPFWPRFARWFFKDFRPGSRPRPRDAPLARFSCLLTGTRRDPRSISSCRSPRKKGRRSARARTRGQADRRARPASTLVPTREVVTRARQRGRERAYMLWTIVKNASWDAK